MINLPRRRRIGFESQVEQNRFFNQECSHPMRGGQIQCIFITYNMYSMCVCMDGGHRLLPLHMTGYSGTLTFI